MMKKNLIFITFIAIFATLTLMLSGCGRSKDDFDGKNIVTFEINGGMLDYGTSTTKTNINFVYHPGTYIKDPVTFPNYTISKAGYVFTGWYTSNECKAEQKWDFENTTFDTETLTLYAGWKLAINHTYSVHYKDGEEDKVAGVYPDVAGEKFEDWRDFADTRKGYTCIGYYSDADCTIPWDYNTTHPGGEADLDIPVYAKYIEGEWELVDTFDKLKSAIKRGNVYLTADIDCGGKEFYVSGTYDRIFEGNNFTVSNFKVEKRGSGLTYECSLFKALGSKADIRNVKFEDVKLEYMGVKTHLGNNNEYEVTSKVAALAAGITDGAKISNVTVEGTIETDYAGELSRLEDPAWYKEALSAETLANIVNFSADIEIVNPNEN